MTLRDSHYHGQPYSASPTSTSTLLAYAVLFVIFLYYVCQYVDFYPLLPLAELLWNCLVYSAPERLISILDPTYSGYISKDNGDNQQAASSASKNRARKSEALRRVLGLDGTGILTTVQRTRNLPTLASMTAIPSKAPPGLGNWDNSCYQNSILQGLASLRSLPEYLSQGGSDNEEPATCVALKDLVARLNSPSNAGKMFWTPPELKSMSSWQQQDAQEYFSKVLDEVDKEVSQSTEASFGEPGLRGLIEPQPKMTANGKQPRTDPSRYATRIHGLPSELKSLMARNPLEGLLAQRVGCLKCGYVEGLSLIPFNCLTVPLGRQWMYDVRTCLDEYTSLEPINGVECAKCTLLRAKQQFETLLVQFKSMSKGETETPVSLPEALKESLEERLGTVVAALDEEDFSDARLKKCEISASNRVSTTKSRQAVIARAPKSLVIHVNRSVFDEMTGAQRKNFADVRFPEVLDLSSWCLGSDLSPEDGKTALENWTVDPAASMLSPEIQEVPPELQKPYELRAVVTHYGRHENGHYICYRRYTSPPTPEEEQVEDKEPTERWWRLSDDEVSEVSEDNVLSQGGVFMLFYERIEQLQPPEANRAEKAATVDVPSIAPSDPITAEDADEFEDAVPLPVSTVGSTAASDIQHDSEAQARPVPVTTDSQNAALTAEESSPGLETGALCHSTSPENPTTIFLPESSPAASPSVSVTPSTASDNDSHATFSESASTEPSSVTSSRTSTPTPIPQPEADPSLRPEDISKDIRQITPSMRTAPPRGGRRSSKGMGQVSSMISAN